MTNTNLNLEDQVEDLSSQVEDLHSQLTELRQDHERLVAAIQLIVQVLSYSEAEEIAASLGNVLIKTGLIS